MNEAKILDAIAEGISKIEKRIETLEKQRLDDKLESLRRDEKALKLIGADFKFLCNVEADLRARIRALNDSHTTVVCDDETSPRATFGEFGRNRVTDRGGNEIPTTSMGDDNTPWTNECGATETIKDALLNEDGVSVVAVNDKDEEMTLRVECEGDARAKLIKAADLGLTPERQEQLAGMANDIAAHRKTEAARKLCPDMADWTGSRRDMQSLLHSFGRIALQNYSMTYPPEPIVDGRDIYVLYALDFDKPWSIGYLRVGQWPCAGLKSSIDCDTHEDLQGLIDEIRGSIAWFADKADAVKWMIGRAWAADYCTDGDARQNFIAEAICELAGLNGEEY